MIKNSYEIIVKELELDFVSSINGVHTFEKVCRDKDGKRSLGGELFYMIDLPDGRTVITGCYGTISWNRTYGKPDSNFPNEEHVFSYWLEKVDCFNNLTRKKYKGKPLDETYFMYELAKKLNAMKIEKELEQSVSL